MTMKRIAGRRPTSGIPAQLTTHDGNTLAVSVDERGDDMLLVLLVDPGALLDGPRGDMTLESMTQRGLVRLHGTAELVERDLVRFRISGQEELVQRREYVRVIAPQRVTLDDACGHVEDTNSVNISGGGMLLSGPPSLEFDEQVRFSIFLEERQKPVVGIGRVIRAARDNQRAVVFEHIDDHDRDRLIHFIFDRQRRALAVTRGDAL
jgi:hypothetical protein